MRNFALKLLCAFLLVSLFTSGLRTPIAMAEGSPIANNMITTKQPAAGFTQTKGFPDRMARDSIYERTAATTFKVTTDITVSNKTRTFNSNVLIPDGKAIILGTNGNVVVNGDLYILGSFSMGSATSLIVNGDIYASGEFFVGGGSVTVNKAAAGGISGKTGGSIFLYRESGISKFISFDVLNNAKITINKTSSTNGFYVMDDACFRMTSSSALFTVNGVVMFDGGPEEPAILSAGNLVINGNFYQGSDNCSNSFAPSPNYKVTINGSSTASREVFFESSSDSYFDNVVLNNVKFTSTSWISIKKNLSSDLNLNCNDGQVEYQGKLNGHKLTVTAKGLYTTDYSSVTLGGGCLTVNGNLIINGPSTLIMNQTTDKAIVNGNFVAMGLCNLAAGRLEVNGNFLQVDLNKGNSYGTLMDNYVPSANFVTKISGINRTVLFDSPEVSYFTKLELSPGTTINSSSIVSIKCSLSSDVKWTFPKLYFSGNLCGHTLTLIGSMILPMTASGAINVTSNELLISHGSLIVSGDLAINGALRMINSDDTVRVGRNFTANITYNTPEMTNGKLYIGSNFSQTGFETSFRATGSHTTILNGTAAQTVTFAYGSKTSGSTFAHLVVLNDSLSTSAIPKFYNDLVVSGTSLAGIASDKGMLSPAFKASTTAYKLFLSGTNSCVITPSLPTRYTGAAMTIDGVNNATNKAIIGLLYSGSKTVTIVVHAYNDLAQKTYTIKAEILCPYLGSLNLLTGSYCTPSFAFNVYSYAVSLPATAASFQWSPKPYNPDATVTVNGAALPVTVATAANTPKTCTMHVTQQDGTPGKDYTVVFTRQCPVSNITVSAGTLTFDPAKASYLVTIPSTASSVTLTVAKKTSDSNGVIQINGTAATKITASLAAGASQVVTIRAWDSAGKAVTTYTVTVKRAAA